MFRRRDDKYHLVAACGITEEVIGFVRTHPFVPEQYGDGVVVLSSSTSFSSCCCSVRHAAPVAWARAVFPRSAQSRRFRRRVLATDAPLFAGPRIPNATGVTGTIARLPGVDAVLQLRLRDAVVVEDHMGGDTATGRICPANRFPVRPTRSISSVWMPLSVRCGRRWKIKTCPRCGCGPRDRDRSASGPFGPSRDRRSPAIALRRQGQRAAARDVRDLRHRRLPVRQRGRTDSGDKPRRHREAVRRDERRPVGDPAGAIRAGADAGAAAAAIHAALPHLHVVTNEELVERFSRVEFSYFRQISVVLATVTLFFGFLLIAVLLTVSVNRRLGEVAALRALGFSRWRVVAGVLIESVILVFTGGLLAIPLGATLSLWLDDILRAMPGVPADLHFFAFEPRALVLHVALLAVAALAAAAYPMRIVGTLPIAATLRREVVS